MEAWIIWTIVAAVLIVVEVMSQMMWALCLAIGAMAAAACAFFGVDLTWQIVALTIASLVGYLVLLPLFNRWHARHNSREARTGMDALLGRKAVVTHEIRPGRLGRARIDGDNWQVKAPGSDKIIPAGAEVVVTSYDSIILDVNPVD